MGSTPISDWDVRIQAAEIGLDVQHASPPTSAYVGKDDSLWIMCSNNAASTVTVNARFLMPNGDIKLNQWALNFTLSRAAQFKQIQLPECFLLSVALVNNTINSATNISCYVAAIVSRLVPTAFNAAQTLCQGYSSGTMAISWPTGVNTTNVDCVGISRIIQGTTPAAGAEISETVPASAKWRVASIRFSLTTSAAVANRVVNVAFDDGSGFIFAATGVTFNQTASLTFVYNFAQGYAGVTGAGTPAAVQLPSPMFLPQFFRFRTQTVGIQAADQYTPPIYMIEEWLQP